jgi:hypothetical protein
MSASARNFEPVALASISAKVKEAIRPSANRLLDSAVTHALGEAQSHPASIMLVHSAG